MIDERNREFWRARAEHGRVQRFGLWQIAVILVGMALLALFARPTATVLIISGGLAILAAWTTFDRARSGALDAIPGIDKPPPPGRLMRISAVVLPAAILAALFAAEWIGAVTHLLAYGLGALVGIILGDRARNRP